MSRTWHQGGSYKDWRRVRAYVLQENLINNEGKCCLQIGGKCKGQATTVHHVVSRQEVGDDPSYLIATCEPCNLSLGSPTRNSPPSKRVSNW